MPETKRFLVVEDDEDSGFLVERALRRTWPDADVVTFRDGAAALKAAHESQWHGIVVHRSLDVDGLEVVKRVRRADQAIPIVFISGRDQKAEAVDAGATHFLPYGEWQQLPARFGASG